MKCLCACLILLFHLYGIESDVAAQDDVLKELPSVDDHLSIDGSLRYREEYVDPLSQRGASPTDPYTFGGLKSRIGVRYRDSLVTSYLEGQLSQGIGFPENSNGIGAGYRAANGDDGSPTTFSLRRVYATLSPSTPFGKMATTIGRFAYASGLETSVGQEQLQWLKTRRISERMFGPYEFLFGRSMDGARIQLFGDSVTATAAAFRPTEGGFLASQSRAITDVTVAAASLTTNEGRLLSNAEGQLFYYFYEDTRHVAVVDNRSIIGNASDLDAVRIHSIGMHYVKVFTSDDLSFDSLLWSCGQLGSYGDLSHEAYAFALEGGARLDSVYGRPWLRVGWNYNSGDNDPGDRTHGTFFPMLPARRNYASVPLYTLMNRDEAFAQLIWQAFDGVSLLGSVHHVRLANTNDLLYNGAGAETLAPGNFGFQGIATGGAGTVGTLVDLTTTVKISDHTTLMFYAGRFYGGEAFEQQFANRITDYAFAQLLYSFSSRDGGSAAN